jgi:hypothetical protein
MTIKPLTVRTPQRSSDRTEPSAPKPRLSLRLRVGLSRFRLDCELAAGQPAGASKARALRAMQLTDLSTRRKVARSLRHTVADARRPNPPGFSSAVPMRRDAVRSCGEAMLGLADRLEQEPPMSASAVARVLVLLRDGTGPLYNAGCRQSLDEAVWAVVDADQGCTEGPMDVRDEPPAMP